MMNDTAPAKPPLKIMHLLFGMDEVREILADLQHNAIALKMHKQMLLGSATLAGLLTLGYFQTSSGFCGAGMVMTLPIVGYALLTCLALWEKSDRTLRTLNNTLDVRALSPLCEALEWRDGSVRDIACHTLPLLLRQLRATDSLLLTRVARECLYSELVLTDAERYGRLRIAILKALEQVGDAQAVPYVERLVAAVPHNAAQERIHLAAQECLPYLHARFGHFAGRKTLLRPLDQEEPTPHMLLRSSASPDEDVESLLRSIKESDAVPEQLLRPG